MPAANLLDACGWEHLLLPFALCIWRAPLRQQQQRKSQNAPHGGGARHADAPLQRLLHAALQQQHGDAGQEVGEVELQQHAGAVALRQLGDERGDGRPRHLVRHLFWCVFVCV